MALSSTSLSNERPGTSGSYGSLPGSALLRAKPLQEERSWQWHSYGDSWALFLEAASLVGQQLLALLLVSKQMADRPEYVMRCNPLEIGTGAAYACEYTKAYLRLFPLLALVAGLIVAGRMLLHRRVYYEMLRHKALVDFENLDFWRDPLVYWLLWDFVHVLGHLVVDLCTSGKLRKLESLVLQNQWDQSIAMTVVVLKEFFTYYLLPVLVFVLFFWGAYDTEATLLPLNKYVEEDPLAAGQQLAETAVLPEPLIAAVVGSGLGIGAGEKRTSPEAFAEVVGRVLAVMRSLESADQVRPTKSNSQVALTLHANSNPVPITGLVFQAAVPKHAKVQINPPSSTTVPPSASGVVTQVLRISNPMHDDKPMVMRVKLDYALASAPPVSDMVQVDTFPPGV